MSKNIHLSSEDKEFIELVSKATFYNPFSDERERIVLKIAGMSARAARESIRERLIDVVSNRIKKMAEEGKNNLENYDGEEREQMEHLFLFEVYYCFISQFDDLIEKQLNKGEVSVPVTFATDIIQMLISRGFEEDTALLYLALFYQIRRAFYFIDRALIGKSPCMRQLRLQLWNNVFTYDIRWYVKYLFNRMEDFSILLLGDTGTGKGTAAVAIGRSGFIPYDIKKGCFAESFARAFISINLSQYQEQLIESELFGHKKGAFTGAIDNYDGIFARCSPHGAIFLDEIGDVSVPIQIKLLQVIQERVFFSSRKS